MNLVFAFGVYSTFMTGKKAVAHFVRVKDETYEAQPNHKVEGFERSPSV